MSDSHDNNVEHIQTAQKLIQQRRYNDALQRLTLVLNDQSDHIDGLYMMAVCQRYTSNYDEALKTLQSLKKHHPEFGRAYQEEGHVYKALGDDNQAIIAFHQASQFNPALHASWSNLADLFGKFGDANRQQHALSQVSALKQLAPELLAATNLFYEGKLARAEDLCRHYLRKNPKNTQGMRLLADIGERLGAMDEAEFLLESAVEFEPNNLALKLAYVEILRKRQKFDAALDAAKDVYERDPNNPMFQAQFAIQKMQAGDYQGSIDLYDEVIKALPDDPAAWASKGHAQKTYGLQDDAIRSYQQSYKVRADYGEGYFSLSNLKTYKFSDEEIENMRHQLSRDELLYKDRILLCFALGKACEDKELFEESFRRYAEGNELGRVRMRYNADKMTEELQTQIETCTADLFKVKAGLGHKASDPIFILGLPRAGSTLLEQIIASHSQVDGTHELSNILSLAHKLRGKGRATGQSKYPAVMHDLTAEQLSGFGEKFIEDTKIHRQDAPYFIDKMPNNFRHIGLIHLILPNAKIIDARRHPMACCFSGFKQHFAEGQEFTYGLKEVGQYYRDYVNLMDHWDEVLPGKILRVQYEDVVADTETQVRRILDYLGLPFEVACLEFHKTKRSVRTASSEQVRQPIYKSGVDQWRHYEDWLGPLKDALGPEVLTRYPIEDI